MTDNKKTKEALAERVFGAEANSAARMDREKLGGYADIASKMFNTPVLRPREMVFPSIATFAAKLINGIGSYRALYFVSVLKIDMVYVTAILTLISVWDVLNDPLMGIAYDKTRTRWGKARPFMLFAPIPYFISTAVLYSGAMFLTGESTSDPKKIIFVFVALFIQETFSTIYSIPNANMPSLMTPNPHDRITMGLIQTYAGRYAGDLIASIYMPLQDFNRWGLTNISQPVLFAVLGWATAVAGIAGNLSMAFGCRERILLQPKPAPITKTMFYVLKNKYALRNFAASFASSWWSNGGYAWDVVTQLEVFGGSFKTALFYAPYQVINVLGIALIPKFRKRFKTKKNMVITIRFWDLTCSVLTCLLGMRVIDNSWLVGAVFAFFYSMNGLNNAASDVYQAEIDREINDYTEYKTGERPDGTISLLQNLLLKITSPLNALMTIAVFRWTGYDPTLERTPWAQNNVHVYRKVFALFTISGAFSHVVSTIPYFFYDLEGEKREQMYMALNERRALMAEEKSLSAEMEAMLAALAQEE